MGLIRPASAPLATMPNTKTRAFRDRAEFLLNRTRGVGSGDIASVVGYGYKSTYQLWKEKTEKLVDETPLEELKSQLELGIRFEGVVLEMALDRLLSRKRAELVEKGELPERDTSFDPYSIERPSYSFLSTTVDGDALSATVDAVLIDWTLKKGVATPERIVEAKTTAGFAAKRYANGLPKEIFLQVTWQMGVSQIHAASVFVLDLSKRSLMQFDVSFDADLFAWLEEEALQFCSLVETGEAPDSVERFSDPKFRPAEASDTDKRQASAEIRVALRQIDELDEQISALEDEKKQLVDRVKIWIGDATELVDGDQRLATWKFQESTRFDSKAFQAKEPELYSHFTKTTSSRVFRLVDASKRESKD